jgi:anhydro-N-acetylmuramic acid kinase
VSQVLVGLMSGTSLDGVSAAVVRFHADGDRHRPEVLAFEVLEFDAERRERIARALTSAVPEEYCRLNFDLGHWLADAAMVVIAQSGVPRDDIAAIASHGQTVWHVPGHSTWQTGEAAVIAERTGIAVLSDFRVRDMAAGGQGAPLVPIADALLFSHESRWRALQNLGGIGNVTVVPPGGRLEGTRAFDTGPGVVVIDGVVRALRPGRRFDVDGVMASEGTAIESVLTDALSHPYFAAPPPKSTGRELYTPAYIASFIDACRRAHPTATDADMVATALELTARSIGDAYRRFLPEPIDEVVVSGGGARNPVLTAAIARCVAPINVRRFDDVFFDGEAKEAVAFAFMGHLHLLGRPANVPSATGARGPRVLGKLTPA